MNEPQDRGGDVALFIDWENFKISLASGHRTPNVSALKEEAANQGRVVVAKAYADWVTRSPELRGASQFINDPPALYAAGIEPVYVPTRLSFGPPSSTGYARTTRIKNSVDVKMTTDCIETAHSHPNIDTYILVSGDSDFIHVINTLRTMGKRVVIIGVSWSISRRLADQVDGLILYDVDVEPETPQEPAPVTRTFARSTSANGPSTAPDLTDVIRAIEDIVREERRAGGTPLLTSIKQRVIRRFPNFDEHKIGYSGFKKLMARVAQEGQIKLITAGLVDWAIMADEPEPDDADEQTPTNGRQAAAILEPGEPEEPEPSVIGSDDEELEDQAPLVAETPAWQPVSQTPATPAPQARPIPTFSPVPPEDRLEPDVLLEQIIAGLQDLPEGPDDGLSGRRVSDLLIMADTLERRDDVDHVAFNFLVGEVCQALEQGLAAADPDIQLRWAQTASRNYVSKMLRSLGNGNLFLRAWHSSQDQASGRSKRRRTFDLDRENPLVRQVLQAHWQTADQDDQPVAAGQDHRPPVVGDLAEEEFEGDFQDGPQDTPFSPSSPDPVDSSGSSGLAESSEPADATEAPFLQRLFRPRR